MWNGRRLAPNAERYLKAPADMAALNDAYDVAIVDLMLPKREGLSVIDELRRRGIPFEVKGIDLFETREVRDALTARYAALDVRGISADSRAISTPLR